MRTTQLTFTRFIAAIAIVIYHYGVDIFPFNKGYASFFFKQANIGVSYFFILSGFVMSIAYADREVLFFDYIKNRFARIYPVYLLALLVLSAYIIIVHGYREFNYTDFGLGVLALQAWVPAHVLSLNIPGWSLSVEFFFYITFPFLINYIYNKYTIKYLLIASSAFWIVSQFIFNYYVKSDFYNGFPSKSHDLLFYFPLMHLNEFIAGNIAGLFFEKYLTAKRKNYDIIIIVLTIMLLVILKVFNNFNFHDGLLAIIFIPLILFIALNNGFITYIFNCRPLVFLGEISFSIYILQLPVYMWVGGIFKYIKVINPSVQFYMYFLVLLVVSAVSYVFIESPMRDKIKKIKLSLAMK